MVVTVTASNIPVTRKMLNARLNLLAFEVKSVLGDRIRIIKVDVDKYGVTASQYRIQSVPTLMLFRNGEVLWRTSGVVDKAELLATLDPFLT